MIVVCCGVVALLGAPASSLALPPDAPATTSAKKEAEAKKVKLTLDKKTARRRGHTTDAPFDATADATIMGILEGIGRDGRKVRSGPFLLVPGAASDDLRGRLTRKRPTPAITPTESTSRDLEREAELALPEPVDHLDEEKAAAPTVVVEGAEAVVEPAKSGAGAAPIDLDADAVFVSGKE